MSKLRELFDIKAKTIWLLQGKCVFFAEEDGAFAIEPGTYQLRSRDVPIIDLTYSPPSKRQRQTPESGTSTSGAQLNPTCCVCQETRNLSVCTSCGHTICNVCGSRINACPLCRAELKLVQLRY